MAVTTKKILTHDTIGNKMTQNVHYLVVNKGNRKGAAELIGGQLLDHPEFEGGWFHIVLPTKVNGEPRMINVETGDVVFRTGESKRWQVLPKDRFKKRFPKIQL